MFAWLRGKEETPACGDDCVWLSNAARIEGMRRIAERSLSLGRSVVIVTSTLAAFENVAAAFAERNPLLCRDMFERDALRRALQSGRVLAVAMPGALPAEPQAEASTRADLLVYGRADSRAADDAIMRAASMLQPDAGIAFHLSLDDTLLKRHSAALKPLLEKLGASADEPIVSPFLTRAIGNAQAK